MRGTHRMQSVRIDYEDEASIPKGFAATLKITGQHLDVLFNNGAYAVPALVEDLPTEALRAIFEANFFGWHTLTRLAIKQMRQQKEGASSRILRCWLRPTEIQAHIMLPNSRLRD